MGKYRKKPVVIEAIQFIDDAERILEIQEFTKIDPLRVNYEHKDNPFIVIPTLEGDMRASIGDYIIRGVNGEYYPCKPDIFEKTYEKVEETNTGIFSEECFGIRCCGCNELYRDDDSGYSMFVDEQEARWSAEDSGWKQINGKCYCPDCVAKLFDYDEEKDEYVPKEVVL